MALTWEGLAALPTPEQERPMPYLILKSCIAGGLRRNAGDVVEIDGVEAGNLVAMGRAEVAPDVEKPKSYDRSVALGGSDAPAPKKRARKSKKSEAKYGAADSE